MRKGLFWLNDRQWARIAPHLPTNLTGPVRDDDRRIISGIVHMLQSGARWRDCPLEYGPYTTIYNRFNRWAKRGRWQAIFEALAKSGKDSVTLSLDSTSIKAHAPQAAEKGGMHAGNRSLPRRTHHENPCSERSALSAIRLASHARPGRRHRRRTRCLGARATDARAACRQRL